MSAKSIDSNVPVTVKTLAKDILSMVDELRKGSIPGPRRVSKIEVRYQDDGLTIESVGFYWTDTGNEPFLAHEYVGRVRYEMELVQARIDGLNGAINSTE